MGFEVSPTQGTQPMSGAAGFGPRRDDLKGSFLREMTGGKLM